MDNYKLIKNNDLNKFQYLCNDLLDNDYRLYGDLKIINSNKEDFYIQSFIKNSLIIPIKFRLIITNILKIN